MIYTISDIHGCYDKYMKMLETIHFGPEDTLYVLGDVIDRGPDGFKILLDMASRPNVVALRGNHEDMAIRALPQLVQSMKGDVVYDLDEQEADAIDLWLYNGGEYSLSDFLWLDETQAQTAWNYLQSMPLYQKVEVNGKQFVLAHGGLGGFSLTRPLEDYTSNEILWCRPEPDTVYYPDKLLICGHTPTQLLRDDANEAATPASIFRADTFIDIDCGCVFRDGRLGCLCLDTLEEIYV